MSIKVGSEERRWEDNIGQWSSIPKGSKGHGEIERASMARLWEK